MLGNLQKYLLVSILVFLPANLGKHFVSNFSYVIGSLVDYLIPTLYLTDILILLLFICYAFELLFSEDARVRTYVNLKTPGVLLLLLFIVVSIPNIDTRNLPGAWYKWLKLLEVCFFSFYISLTFDFVKKFKVLTTSLAFPVLFESSLALFQWYRQRSLFGYYFFGEALYNAQTFNIAHTNFFGIRLVRSYGTFPHPNVLGGFLSLTLPFLLLAFLTSRKVRYKVYFFLVFVIGVLGLFVSFSRSAWLVFLVGSLLYLLNHFIEAPREVFARNLLGWVSLVWVPLLLISLSSFSQVRLIATPSVRQRYELLHAAFKMFLKRPIFGVGLNNFVVRLEEFGRITADFRFLQPVHNIYLLIAAELGLLGFLSFIALLVFSLKEIIKKMRKVPAYSYLLISFCQLLLLGLFDHYLLTLQQGLLLFFLLLGMSLKTG